MGLYIAPDGGGEPTLWDCPVIAHDADSCDWPRPIPLTRKCDVGNQRAWTVLVVGVMAVRGES